MSRKGTAVARWDEPKLLAGDIERDEAFKRITLGHVEGRISAGMMNDMLDQAQKAVRIRDLAAICKELPELPEPRESRLRSVLGNLWFHAHYGLIPAGLLTVIGGIIFAMTTAPLTVIDPGGNDGFGDKIPPTYGGVQFTGRVWMELAVAVVIGLWMIVAGCVFLDGLDD